MFQQTLTEGDDFLYLSTPTPENQVTVDICKHSKYVRVHAHSAFIPHRRPDRWNTSGVYLVNMACVKNNYT